MLSLKHNICLSQRLDRSFPYALKTIPIGNAYAVWTGIGAVGVAIVGIIWFGEIADPRRIAFIGLIVVGVLGLGLIGSGSSPV
jgi:quaternary ammonium compound-resistance protein SugE